MRFIGLVVAGVLLTAVLLYATAPWTNDIKGPCASQHPPARCLGQNAPYEPYPQGTR